MAEPSVRAMTTLRTTVIMKTDISGSTVRFRALGEADLHALLLEHREFLSRHAAAHGGHIVKPEGDGFWLVFPSVTAAALAAMAMQEELTFAQPNKADDRLVMRVVIALGDVLHEEGALVGETVALTARIESITPPDEIYLSAAAWLVVNQAEVRTAAVDAFALKGFTDPVPVYRVEQTHRTRVIANQYVVFADLRGFSRMTETSPVSTVEKSLETMYDLTSRIARELGGTVRFNVGDAHCLTFPQASVAVSAAHQLSERWGAFAREEKLACAMNLAVHQGMMYAFRSYLYGPGLEVTHLVERACSRMLEPGEGSVFVTSTVRDGLHGTEWEGRLHPVDIGSASPELSKITVYRLVNA